MGVNWGMAGQGNNALAYFQLGQQLGQQMIDGKLNRAVAAYQQGDQAALNQVMSLDPRVGMQLEERRAQQMAAQAKAQQDEIAARRGKAMEVARLFDGVSDEATYQQRLSIAQRMGIDTSGAPANFNPQWVQENALIMRFAAEKPEALSAMGKEAVDAGYQPGTPDFNNYVRQRIQAEAMKTIPYTEGGGVAGFNPMTGETKTIVAPNPGGYSAGTPVQGGVREGQTATNPSTGEKIVFRQGRWQPMGGQPAGAGPFAQ